MHGSSHDCAASPRPPAGVSLGLPASSKPLWSLQALASRATCISWRCFMVCGFNIWGTSWGPPSPGKRPRLGGRCLSIPDPAGRAAPILFLLLNTVSSRRGEHVCPRGHEARSAGPPAWSSGTSRNSAGCIHSGLPVVWEWACGKNAGMHECSESLSGGPQGRSWHL